MLGGDDGLYIPALLNYSSPVGTPGGTPPIVINAASPVDHIKHLIQQQTTIKSDMDFHFQCSRDNRDDIRDDPGSIALDPCMICSYLTNFFFFK